MEHFNNVWLLMLFRINIVYLKHKNLVCTNTELLYTYKRMEWSDSSTMKLWQILRSQYWFKLCFISVWLLQLCEHFYFFLLLRKINQRLFRVIKIHVQKLNLRMFQLFWLSSLNKRRWLSITCHTSWKTSMLG